MYYLLWGVKVPNYPYKCTKCDYCWEDFKPIRDRLTAICPQCGKKGEIDYSELKSNRSVFPTFVTDTLFPKKTVEIHSKNQYKSELDKAANLYKETLVNKYMDYDAKP